MFLIRVCSLERVGDPVELLLRGKGLEQDDRNGATASSSKEAERGWWADLYEVIVLLLI